jgi:hypothetical protein
MPMAATRHISPWTVPHVQFAESAKNNAHQKSRSFALLYATRTKRQESR